MFNRILLVCVGNICRSPMAEGLLGCALHVAEFEDVEVRSAGLHALAGQPADKIAQRLLLGQGIDISAHRAHQLNRDLMRWADLVLVMEKSQLASVEYWEPSAKGKVFRLGEWSDFDVPDPYRKEEEFFENILGLITKGVNDWVAKLKE